MTSSQNPHDPWKNLFGKKNTHLIFSEFARGLQEETQLHALFTSYELNPELFEIRLRSTGTLKAKKVCSILSIARDYALFRERAFHESKNKSSSSLNPERLLLESIPPSFRLEPREWIGFWAQYRQGNWTKLEWIERGVRTHVNFDASEFFGRLLTLRPKAFILVHNHPSGITTPSWIDYQLTDRVGSLAKAFGIELKGHWIIGPHSESWMPHTTDLKNRERGSIEESL